MTTYVQHFPKCILHLGFHYSLACTHMSHFHSAQDKSHSNHKRVQRTDQSMGVLWMAFPSMIFASYAFPSWSLLSFLFLSMVFPLVSFPSMVFPLIVFLSMVFPSISYPSIRFSMLPLIFHFVYISRMDLQHNL